MLAWCCTAGTTRILKCLFLLIDTSFPTCYQVRHQHPQGLKLKEQAAAAAAQPQPPQPSNQQTGIKPACKPPAAGEVLCKRLSPTTPLQRLRALRGPPRWCRCQRKPPPPLSLTCLRVICWACRAALGSCPEVSHTHNNRGCTEESDEHARIFFTTAAPICIRICWCSSLVQHARGYPCVVNKILLLPVRQAASCEHLRSRQCITSDHGEYECSAFILSLKQTGKPLTYQAYLHYQFNIYLNSVSHVSNFSYSPWLIFP